MTLYELKLIKTELKYWGPSDEPNVEEAIRIINREINLKTMNVTKSKEDDPNMKNYGE